MPSSNVNWPTPLTRLRPWYPGQVGGVPGTDSREGLRQSTDGIIFYVDPNFPGVSDQRDGTDPDGPLQTVQAAISRCRPYRGDTVAVMMNSGWQYANPASAYNTPIREAVTVNTPGVRIVGVSPSSSLGVPWHNPTSGGTILTVNAIDVTIEGFLFRGHATVGGTAIYSVWSGGGVAYGDNLTVRHCTFDEEIDTAIHLEHVYHGDIWGNFFMRCDAYGVYSDGTPTLLFNTIHDNWFHNVATCAISIVNASLCSIYGNRIFGDPAGANNFIVTTGGTGNIIADNWLACTNLQYGTTCDGAGDMWIRNHCTDQETVAIP
jgi:hypothetical protein